MNSRLRTGFTVVEILIVVVVVAILTVITATIYLNAQVQARDTQMRDAADKFADAISLWSARHDGARPRGGYDNSLSNVYDSITENCSLYNVAGWAAAKFGTAGSTYGCTVGDVVVNTGYLPSDFFTKLDSPIVPYLKEFMIPGCGATTDAKTVYLLYVVEEPTAKEVADYDALATSCAMAGAYRTSYAMNTYIEIPIN